MKKSSRRSHIKLSWRNRLWACTPNIYYACHLYHIYGFWLTDNGTQEYLTDVRLINLWGWGHIYLTCIHINREEVTCVLLNGVTPFMVQWRFYFTVPHASRGTLA